MSETHSEGESDRREAFRLPILLCAAALAASPRAPAQDEVLQQTYGRYDNDGDKKVTRKEFPGSDQQFADMDKNKDGSVTFAEFEVSPTARRLLVARRNDAGAPRARADLDQLVLRRLEVVARFDQNRDGKVQEREWTGSPTAFKELDLDRDGVLDASDRALARKRLEDGDQPDELPEFKSRVEGAEALLERLDRDKDQVLTKAELKGHKLLGAFAAADRNKDERIDVEELRRLVGAVNAMVYARERGTEKPRPYQVPFDAWDKNKDERIEANEWAGNRYLFGRIDSDRDAAVTRQEIERYERSVLGSTFVERFDLNDDGRVTLAEFGGSPNAFRRADRNGDGTVTRADR